MSILWGKQVSELSGAAEARAQGFDFVQPVGSRVADMSDQEFRAEKARIADSGIPLAAFPVPLPSEARVTERGFNLYAWTEHLKRAMPRAAELGCRKLLWTDGRARVLPEEGDVAGLKAQAAQFLFLLCDVAANLKISVLVEPLDPRRTNFLNSMKEIDEFLSRVGKENLGCMISLRELDSIGLPVSKLGGYRRLVRYVQMENPLLRDAARASPRPSDGFDYRPFLRALKDIGYGAEVGLPMDADADSLAYCRELLQQA
jgi:sugar phosphate isomerase/epimerase